MPKKSDDPVLYIGHALAMAPASQLRAMTGKNVGEKEQARDALAKAIAETLETQFELSFKGMQMDYSRSSTGASRAGKTRRGQDAE